MSSFSLPQLYRPLLTTLLRFFVIVPLSEKFLYYFATIIMQVLLGTCMHAFHLPFALTLKVSKVFQLRRSRKFNCELIVNVLR